MKHFWMGIAVLATACGTAGTEDPTTADGLVTPEIESFDDARADHLAPRHLVTLQRPQAMGCAGPTLTSTPAVGGSIGGPVLEEVFGADGCIDEQYIRDWDGDKLLREDYDWFEPNLAKFTYMLPFAYTATFTYDADGRVLEERRTRDGSALAYSVTRNVYDAQGRKIEQSEETTEDGGLNITWERRQTWSYNAAGEVEVHEAFNNGELSRRVRTSFGADGQIDDEHTTHDNIERLTLRNTYDANRNLTRIETWRANDGAIEADTLTELRPDGTKRRSVQNVVSMGYVNTYEYDAAERELLYTQDTNGDGTPNYRRETQYDARGNKTYEGTSYGFGQANGPRINEMSWVYDAQDREIESEARQTWLKGDTLRTRTTYDAVGRGYRVEVDRIAPDGSVTPNSIAHYLDPDREAWRLNTAGLGTPLQALTIQRWDGGRLLELLQDFDGNGYLDSVQQWHYDASGQLTEELSDLDGNGIADRRVTYTR